MICDIRKKFYTFQIMSNYYGIICSNGLDNSNMNISTTRATRYGRKDNPKCREATLMRMWVKQEIEM